MHHSYSLSRRLFTPAIHAPGNADGVPGFWYVFRGYRLLVAERGDRVQLPLVASPAELELQPERVQFLGWLDDVPCYAAEVAVDANPPLGWRFEGLRSLLDALDTDLFWLAGRAVQIVDWDRTHQFCGRCGTQTVYHARDRARVCPACGLVHYPRLSPAIIVAVLRDDKILLARSHRHPPGRYSVLAGFVEPGETLEECVAREVKEEVDLDVENVRYFGSQPWPFPHSLMIAFTCEAPRGEIELDTSEMAEAGWFRADELPPVPPPPTISRRLIDWFAGTHRSG
ncbi:MAG: NAD(+) diphosphatase [Anaerolineae bacterium]|nr:NAD(+) diphosphatase [Anaerolineae bacterium]